MLRLKEKLEEAAERDFREKLREKRESDSHYQQLKRTPEERRRRHAVDEIGGQILDHARKQGQDPSYEDCRKQAEKSMERVERRERGEK